MDSGESLKFTLMKNLKQQISEFEVITSIFPKNEDIIRTDANALQDIKDFVENKTNCLPNHLDFTLNLLIDGFKLEISINLPSLYPAEEPDIYIRCNQLNRQQETTFNLDLTNFIKNNHIGEQCLYTAISWIQENIDQYNNKLREPKIPVPAQTRDTDKFTRLWIYSHHIFNKKKRDEIVKMAREYNLTGFCLSGKPGIVCIEGLEYDCQEWWKIIKNLNWKKIVVRKTETFELSEEGTGKKFRNFEEIHADMSNFSKYLEKYGLSQVFNELFGLCST